MRLVDNLLKNINTGKSSIKYKKTFALSIIILATILLISMLIFINIFLGNMKIAMANIVLFLIMIIPLFIIKKGKPKLAGSIVVSIFILIEILAMFLTPNKIEVPFQYYSFFILIIVSSMFTHRSVMIITYILSLVSTIILFYVNKKFVPIDLISVREYNLIAYEALLFMSFLFSYIFTYILNQSINDLSKEKEKASTQNEQMKLLIVKTKENSINLSQASIQLSSISQQISQNANEQAATTEEIATSMEQMLAVINSNTQNAEITGKTSEKSANGIKQSNEIFIKTIKSISEISEKISIITEIADKTDILSINASIEAARAGESGKGFAVVAHEIRELADKTKTASDKIMELSQNGQDISKIAGKALEKVIPKIIKSAELVNKIVSASREQQNNIENINNSIQQLTEISSVNSASAEEMSASAEELSAQAEQLQELISVFKIADLQTEN